MADRFTTGAQRGTQEGKGRYDLLSTIATRELALLLEKGAQEYGERNWEKGIPIMRHLSSAKRHIDQFIERQVTEVNSKGDTVMVKHAVNAFANLMMAIHTLALVEQGDLPKELDDRPIPSVQKLTPLEKSMNGPRPHKPFLYTVVKRHRDHAVSAEWDIKRISDRFVMDCDGIFQPDFDTNIGWWDRREAALGMYDNIGLNRDDLLDRYGAE